MFQASASGLATHSSWIFHLIIPDKVYHCSKLLYAHIQYITVIRWKRKHQIPFGLIELGHYFILIDFPSIFCWRWNLVTCFIFLRDGFLPKVNTKLLDSCSDYILVGSEYWILTFETEGQCCRNKHMNSCKHYNHYITVTTIVIRSSPSKLTSIS